MANQYSRIFCWVGYHQPNLRGYFAYTLFEKKLLDDNQVIDVDNISIDILRDKASCLSFVKVKGNIVFNDIRSLKDILSNFNNIGLALSYITHHEEIKDRKQIVKINSQSKKFSPVEVAKAEGLQQDKKLFESIETILNYGFQDQLEVQAHISDFIISANLKREFLRENEELIIKKYSRQTERSFTMFGIITQYGVIGESNNLQNESNSLKEHLMGIATMLADVEKNFAGRLDNEVIIDPIALYAEL